MSFRYECVLPSPDGQQLMLERVAGRWILPYVLCEQGWIADAVALVQARFLDRYGVGVAVLRALTRTPSAIACELEMLFAVPSRHGACEWKSLRDPALAELSLDGRAAVENWSEDKGVERRAAPWQRPGWLAEARQWIEDRAGRLGFEPCGRMIQVKAAWNGSCVLKTAASQGPLYFKASPDRRPGEPAVTEALSANWPGHVPAVLAADHERCWMLTREAGEAVDPADVQTMADAAGLMARIQAGEADRIEEWLELGCPVRGLDTLRRNLGRLLADVPGRLCHAGVLEAAERDEIAAFLPRAEELCARLAEFAIPGLSVNHEDFRDGNVRRGPDGKLVIMDWSDAVAAHPFFAIQRFLWFVDPPDGLPRHEVLDVAADALRRAVRDAYLEPFERFESRPRLLEAFDVSCQLAPIYDALRFDLSSDADEAFGRGLDPEEAGSARRVMEEILDVCRRAAGGARGAGKTGGTKLRYWPLRLGSFLRRHQRT